MNNNENTLGETGQDTNIDVIASIIRPQYRASSIADGVWHALGLWLDSREANQPQCLTCERIFNHEVPRAFLVIELGASNKFVMSGVCFECETRTDAELLKHGVRGFFGDEVLRTAKVFDGSVHDSPPVVGRGAEHGSDISVQPEHDEHSHDDGSSDDGD